MPLFEDCYSLKNPEVQGKMFEMLRQISKELPQMKSLEEEGVAFSETSCSLLILLYLLDQAYKALMFCP